MFKFIADYHIEIDCLYVIGIILLTLKEIKIKMELVREDIFVFEWYITSNIARISVLS